MNPRAVLEPLVTVGVLRTFFAAVAVPLLVVLAPFLAFVKHQGYGLLHPEMLLSYSVIGLLGLALGSVLVVMPRIIQLMMVASLLTVFADFQFGAGGLGGNFEILSRSLILAIVEWGMHVRAASLGLVIIVFTGCFATLWVIRLHVMAVVAISFAVINATILLFDVGGGYGSDFIRRTQTVPQADPDLSLPPVVHLILDEHVGIEGIPDEIPGGRELRSLLKQMYVDEGFRLYGRAYSMYYDTYNSMANLVNFSANDLDFAYIGDKSRPMRLVSNAYFRHLADRGYLIRVYQVDYIDYCAGQEDIIEACVTSASTSARAFENLPLNVRSKMLLLWSMFLKKSFVYDTLRKAYRRFVYTPAMARGVALPPWNWERSRVAPLTFIPLLKELARDLRTGARGRVFFAHVLLPHSPYILGRDCRVNPEVDEWIGRDDVSLPWPQKNSPESWRLRYTRYIDQIFCVHRQLFRLLQILRETDSFDDATVIIHGDHGSRIVEFAPVSRNQDRLDHDDFIDGFSTLFAVHAPRLEPGYEITLVPIQQIFPTLWGLPPPRDGEQVLYLTDRVAGVMVALPAAVALNDMRGDVP